MLLYTYFKWIVMLVIRFGIICYFLNFLYIDSPLITQFSFGYTMIRSFSSHNCSFKTECACTNVRVWTAVQTTRALCIGTGAVIIPKSTAQVLLYKIFREKNKYVYSSTKTKQEISFYSMHKDQRISHGKFTEDWSGVCRSEGVWGHRSVPGLGLSYS